MIAKILVVLFGGYMLAKTLAVFYVWSPDIFVLYFLSKIHFQALFILLCRIKHCHTIPYTPLISLTHIYTTKTSDNTNCGNKLVTNNIPIYTNNKYKAIFVLPVIFYILQQIFNISNSESTHLNFSCSYTTAKITISGNIYI